MIDISHTKIKNYIENFKPDMREQIANILCDGEAFVNTFDSDKVAIVLEVISGYIHDEINQMLSLVKEGKHEESEELRQIRKHCISIATLNHIINRWNADLDQLNRHLKELK